MCKTCGDRWLEHALQDTEPQALTRPPALDTKVSSHS
jgi:hypothetical protein